MKALLIFLSLMVFANAEYIRNGNKGVVYDTRTNLVWEDDQIVSEMVWQEAIDYCENLTLGGYDDWRLPNFNEYDSLIDTNRNNPAMSTVFETTVTAEDGKYWTSTTYIRPVERTKAWTLQTRNGWNYTNDKNESDSTVFVRCVRTGD